MTLEQILDSIKQGEGHIPEGWGQGRAVYGGLVAAMTYRHLQQSLDQPGPLRSVAISFVAPGEPGVANFEHELLRQGKSATQASARLVQGGQVKTLINASFGQIRESQLEVPSQVPVPAAAMPDELKPMPFIKGVTPDFIQHLDLRWSTPDVPFSGKGNGEIGGWIKTQEGNLAPSVELLLALVDGWPPSVLPMLKTFAPISSLSWTMDVRHPLPQPYEGGWWRYHAFTDAAEDGYAHSRAYLWGRDDTLVAISRQVVSVFY